MVAGMRGFRVACATSPAPVRRRQGPLLTRRSTRATPCCHCRPHPTAASAGRTPAAPPTCCGTTLRSRHATTSTATATGASWTHLPDRLATEPSPPPPASVLSCVYYKAATDTGSCSAFCERTGAARLVVVAACNNPFRRSDAAHMAAPGSTPSTHLCGGVQLALPCLRHLLRQLRLHELVHRLRREINPRLAESGAHGHGHGACACPPAAACAPLSLFV